MPWRADARLSGLAAVCGSPFEKVFMLNVWALSVGVDPFFAKAPALRHAVDNDGFIA